LSGLTYYDLDEVIENEEKQSISRIFESKGESTFRKIERNTLETILQADNFLLSCGGGTPCFLNNICTLNEQGVTIYLNSTVSELAGRLKSEKETRPLIKNIDDDVLEGFISEKLKERTDCYQKAMYHLHTRFLSNENFERILRRHGK
jgi:shikimate kinase